MGSVMTDWLPSKGRVDNAHKIWIFKQENITIVVVDIFQTNDNIQSTGQWLDSGNFHVTYGFYLGE